jgi:hypothetical protein
MIFCPNCQKLTGYKRSLGFGTFFAVVLTAGLWLLAIPLYPKRCAVCGLTEGESIPWYRPTGAALAVLVGLVLLIAAIIGGSRQGGQQPHSAAEERPQADAQTSESASTDRVNQDATGSVERIASLASTMSPAVHPATVYKVDQIAAQYDDNEILAESLFTGKVVSIWGVVDRLTTSALGGADVTFDEGFPPLGGGHRSSLDCSVDEGQTAQLLTLHKGSIVVMSAEGGKKVMGTVFFQHCRLDRVVPLESFAGDPMMNHLPQESAPVETGTTDSHTSNIPVLTSETGPTIPLPSEAVHRPQLKFASGARVLIHVDSISRQPDGGFTFRGSLLQPLASDGAAALDRDTQIAGSGSVSSGHIRVVVNELNPKGERYLLDGQGENKRNGSGPAVEIVSSKVIEMWFSAPSTYAKAADQP